MKRKRTGCGDHLCPGQAGGLAGDAHCQVWSCLPPSHRLPRPSGNTLPSPHTEAEFNKLSTWNHHCPLLTKTNYSGCWELIISLCYFLYSHRPLFKCPFSYESILPGIALNSSSTRLIKRIYLLCLRCNEYSVKFTDFQRFYQKTYSEPLSNGMNGSHNPTHSYL